VFFHATLSVKFKMSSGLKTFCLLIGLYKIRMSSNERISSSRCVEKIVLPSCAPGNQRYLFVHKWGPQNGDSAYIQASLHADEVPGLLVANHLIKMIQEIDSLGGITKQIIVVPFANPIGLSQSVFERHIGRYCLASSINFNRNWIDLTNRITSKVEALLSMDESSNVYEIRKLILSELGLLHSATMKEDDYLKCALLKYAAIADVALDLHCDSDAILHLYTLDKLWPKLSDLAIELQSRCQLISPATGGNPFDEVCSGLWSNIAEKFPMYPIPIACQSVTVELRGESDVSAALHAHKFITYISYSVNPVVVRDC